MRVERASTAPKNDRDVALCTVRSTNHAPHLRSEAIADFSYRQKLGHHDQALKVLLCRLGKTSYALKHLPVHYLPQC